ncbi:MAG: hypothetical protein ACOX6P_09145 [Candidatus Merdivicinus sp.]
MMARNFEVHYCLQSQQNICVEATTQPDGTVCRQCLYEHADCTSCPYQKTEISDSTVNTRK